MGACRCHPDTPERTNEDLRHAQVTFARECTVECVADAVGGRAWLDATLLVNTQGERRRAANARVPIVQRAGQQGQIAQIAHVPADERRAGAHCRCRVAQLILNPAIDAAASPLAPLQPEQRLLAVECRREGALVGRARGLVGARCQEQARHDRRGRKWQRSAGFCLLCFALDGHRVWIALDLMQIEPTVV